MYKYNPSGLTRRALFCESFRIGSSPKRASRSSSILEEVFFYFKRVSLLFWKRFLFNVHDTLSISAQFMEPKKARCLLTKAWYLFQIGIFQYSWGIVPHRTPIHVVIGAPIDVGQVKWHNMTCNMKLGDKTSHVTWNLVKNHKQNQTHHVF